MSGRGEEKEESTAGVSTGASTGAAQKAGAAGSKPPAALRTPHIWYQIPVTLAFLAIAAAFIAYGISRGEMSVVLRKAVRICMECIGLG